MAEFIIIVASESLSESLACIKHTRDSVHAFKYIGADYSLATIPQPQQLRLYLQTEHQPSR